MWRHPFDNPFRQSSSSSDDDDDSGYNFSSDDDDDDSVEIDGVSIVWPIAAVEVPVCRYFTSRGGCHRGQGCNFKHLSENGECLRCHHVLRLADVEAHCRELCEIRPSSAINSNSQRVGTEAVGTRRATSSNDSDVESISPQEAGCRCHDRVPLGQLGQSSSRGTSSNSSSKLNPTAAALTPPLNPAGISISSQPSSSSSSSTSASCPKTLWKAPKVCRFHLKGFCKFGSRCKFLHLVNNKCVLCEDVVVAGTLDQHLQTCTEYKILKGEMQKTEETDCPICMFPLREISTFDVAQSSNFAQCSNSPNPGGSKSGSQDGGSKPLKPSFFAVDRFALLPDCGHLFCLKCITSWRKESPRPGVNESAIKDRNRCPTCRKKASFTIPCNRVVEGPLRCQREKEIFLHFLKRQPCAKKFL